MKTANFWLYDKSNPVFFNTNRAWKWSRWISWVQKKDVQTDHWHPRNHKRLTPTVMVSLSGSSLSGLCWLPFGSTYVSIWRKCVTFGSSTNSRKSKRRTPCCSRKKWRRFHYLKTSRELNDRRPWANIRRARDVTAHSIPSTLVFFPVPLPTVSHRINPLKRVGHQILTFFLDEMIWAKKTHRKSKIQTLNCACFVHSNFYTGSDRRPPWARIVTSVAMAALTFRTVISLIVSQFCPTILLITIPQPLMS